MKNHLLFTRYLLSLFFVASIANIHPNTINPSTPVNTPIQQTAEATAPTPGTEKITHSIAQQIANHEIEQCKKSLLQLANELDFTLETIAMHIESGSITLADKSTALKNILSCRQTLHVIIRDLMMAHEIDGIANYLHAIKQLQTHIQSVVDNLIEEFPAFDVDTLVTRSKESMTATDIMTEIARLKEELLEVSQDAEQAGISFGNKLYRKTVGGLVDIIEKHNWHEKALAGTAASAALIYFWYRLSQSEVTNPDWNKPGMMNGIKNCYQSCYNVMRKYLGRPWISSIEHDNYLPGYWKIHHDGPLANFDALTTPFMMGQLGLGSIYFGPKLQELYYTHVEPFTRKITRNAYNLHCKLKGGIYHAQNKNRSSDDFRINPRFRFKDIVGYKDLKEFGYNIIEYINDPEKFQRLGLALEKGILLYGPPGTGKSYFVEALFGEIQDALKRNNQSEDAFGFYNIRVSTIREQGIRKILDIMQRHAPCIIFIDEIDLLGLQRDRNADLLNEFLTGLDGYLSVKDPKKQVIVIGATNRKDHLDAGLTRSGRLSKQMFVGYPTAENRYEYLTKSLGNRINPALFNLKDIAFKTAGCTVEDLNTIVKSALFRTRVTGKPLTQQDLEDALNREIRKITIHQEVRLSDQEQSSLALHMAGHALARMMLPTTLKLDTVTIQPVIEKVTEQGIWQQYYKDQEPGQLYGKVFTSAAHDTLGIEVNTIRINECKILLAGRMAEKILLGATCGNNSQTCNGTCKSKALALAKEIVLDGFNEKELSKDVLDDINRKAIALVETLEKEVTTLLEQQKQFLALIAELLLQHKTVSAREIVFVMNAYMEELKNNPQLLDELNAQDASQAQEKQEDNSTTTA